MVTLGTILGVVLVLAGASLCFASLGLLVSVVTYSLESRRLRR